MLYSNVPNTIEKLVDRKWEQVDPKQSDSNIIVLGDSRYKSEVVKALLKGEQKNGVPVLNTNQITSYIDDERCVFDTPTIGYVPSVDGRKQYEEDISGSVITSKLLKECKSYKILVSVSYDDLVNNPEKIRSLDEHLKKLIGDLYGNPYADFSKACGVVVVGSDIASSKEEIVQELHKVVGSDSKESILSSGDLVILDIAAGDGGSLESYLSDHEYFEVDEKDSFGIVLSDESKKKVVEYKDAFKQEFLSWFKGTSTCME